MHRNKQFKKGKIYLVGSLEVESVAAGKAGQQDPEAVSQTAI